MKNMLVLTFVKCLNKRGIEIQYIMMIMFLMIFMMFLKRMRKTNQYMMKNIFLPIMMNLWWLKEACKQQRLKTWFVMSSSITRVVKTLHQTI